MTEIVILDTGSALSLHAAGRETELDAWSDGGEALHVEILCVLPFRRIPDLS